MHFLNAEPQRCGLMLADAVSVLIMIGKEDARSPVLSLSLSLPFERTEQAERRRVGLQCKLYTVFNVV